MLLIALIAPIALALADEPTLELGPLIAQVLEANPDAQAAEAALAGARARADAAGAWPDPMVDLGIAPLSLGHMPGWQVGISQDLPLWGERRAARGMADAGALAVEADLAMKRLMLASMAAMAWAEWWAFHEEIALVERSRLLLREHRDASLSRYSLGRAPTSDPLQAEVELANLDLTLQSLATERDLAAARLNNLLHRPADAPVPAPPMDVTPPPLPEEGDRPELFEADAMARMAEAELAMARLDRRPMLGLMAEWDAMQEMPEHRLMVGVSVEVPLSTQRRAAAVRAAEAELARARALRERAGDAVDLDVAIATRQFEGQAAALEVIEEALLPAARARVEAARSGFASGSVDLRLLLDAERAALDAETRRAWARAILRLRAAELAIAKGGIPR